MLETLKCELNTFWNKLWAKIPPQHCERLQLPVIANSLLHFLVPRVAQQVIRFGGNYFFTLVGLDSFLHLLKEFIF